MKKTFFLFALVCAAVFVPGCTYGESLYEKDHMPLNLVSAGAFPMGSDAGNADEQPEHTVTLEAFRIDSYEVDNNQFEQFVNETGYLTTAETEGSGWVYDIPSNSWVETAGADWRHPSGPDSSLTGRMTHPVVQVSWADAAAYCAWAGRRLPTEAEWEKAARGDEGRTYPWGEGLDCDHANYLGCLGMTRQTGAVPAGESQYLVLDLAGNVAEWTADWYDAGYYAVSPAQNPGGPADGSLRVSRGGSWASPVGELSAWSRAPLDPGYRSDALGFRCGK